MEQIAEWRRGIVYRKQKWALTYAEKRAKSPEMNWAIAKEAIILQKLARHKVNCVPAYIDSGEGRLESERREWEAFHEVREQASAQEKKKLAKELLDAVYELDRCGVLHGELHRPMSNIRVEKKGAEYNITILDFERGMLGDDSGKNMRMLAQRLAQKHTLTLSDLPVLWTLWREDIYLYMKKRIMWSWSMSLSAFFGGVVGLVGIDLLTKYFLYDLRRGEELRILTPAFNTGSGRSLNIPWYISATLASLAVLCLVRAWKRGHIPFVAALCLAAGALGNMYDRVVYHGVRDMFDLHIRPVFNVADMCLTIGCVLYIVRTIWPQFFRKPV